VGEAAAEAAAAAAAGEAAGEAEAEMFPSDQYPGDSRIDAASEAATVGCVMTRLGAFLPPGNLRIDAASEVRAELAAFNKWNNGRASRGGERWGEVEQRARPRRREEMWSGPQL